LSCSFFFLVDRSQSKVMDGQGIGIMRKTANFGMAQVDGQYRGQEQETVEMAYYLLRNEGIFVGPSSGNPSITHSFDTH
jgi:cysteine synthase